MITWTTVLNELSYKTAVSVGVGNGVAAAAALTVGYTAVEGVDLLKQFRLKDIRNNLYPPQLAHHPLRARYTWSPLMYSCNGNLYHPSFTLELKATSARTSLIILDVQPAPELAVLVDLVHQITLNRDMLVRAFQTRNSNEDGHRIEFLQTMASWSKYLRVGDSLQFFFLIRSRSTTTEKSALTLTRLPQIPLNANEWAPFFPTFLDNLAETIGQTTRPLFSVSCELNRLRSAIGRRMMSDDFSSWTDSLARLWTLETLADPESASFILGALDRGEQQFVNDLEHRVIPIDSTPILRSYAKAFIAPALIFYTLDKKAFRVR